MKKRFIVLIFLLAANGFAQIAGREYEQTGHGVDASKLLAALGEGTIHQHVMMPMRDGVKLATEVFIPPGEGPWPVVLVRTPYGRLQPTGYARKYKSGGFVFVTQDPRGTGDSEGTIDPVSSDNEIEDGYDCVEWIAAQPWCNGRVGMIGGSGNGHCANMAYLAKPPHLVAIGSGNTAGNTALYWGFENGVRRWLYDWCKHRARNGKNLPDWPKPTLLDYDRAAWNAKVAEAAKDNPIVYFIDDGWFNLFGDAAFDDFQAFGKTGKVYVKIGPKSHGGSQIRGKAFPSGGVRSAAISKAPALPSFDNILNGAEVTAPSRVLYYVMGDIMDDAAPGNCWKYTETWPPENTPTAFYLHTDGALNQTVPADSGERTYTYDPNDPAPSLGGDFSYSTKPGEESGPLDQRPLQERADVLRFVTEPLDEPLEIAGELRADLYVSTDVPDTLFVVKIVDVYPDGYEAIVREGAFMGRFSQGLENPQPLKKGEVSRLQFGLKNTAIVFNRGHRIAVYVTSSSKAAYEVHPNSFESVDSYADAPVAHTTLHLSSDHPSCIILPVTAPE
jgi:predicted acyl esterase